MKIITSIIVCILLIGKVYSQQCTVSGVLTDTTIKKIRIFLLYSDDAYNSAVVNLIPDSAGRFKQNLLIPYPVFGLLKIDERKHRLLLSPGRDLELNITATSISFGGEAAVENQLVHTSILDTKPFFMRSKNPNGDPAFSQLSEAGWKDLVVGQVEEELEAIHGRIEKANLPPFLKKIMLSDTKYAYQCYMTDYVNQNMRGTKNRYAETILTNVMKWQPLPDSIQLQSGHYANQMLERKIKFNISFAMRGMNGGKAAAKEWIAEYMNMPFETLDSLTWVYSQKAVLDARFAETRLPVAIQDKVFFNLIYEAADGADLNTCYYLGQQMQIKYPYSNYLPRAKNLISKMTLAILKNNANKSIAVKSTGNLQSVTELLKQYKGKVVYLNVWGTTCMPCREEMHYVSDLKKRYTGKNIVFLYIAVDNVEQDKTWKEYLYLNNLEGDHYRVNKTNGDAFWKDVSGLGALPRFMIIDAQGKIVQANAEKPSSKQKLYNQLDKLF